MAKKPLFMHLCVAKESRENPAPEVRVPITTQFKETFSANMNYYMKVNLMFLLFALPFLVLTCWALDYMLGLSAANYNFAGNLGIGYPGVTENLTLGYIAQLDVYLFYFELLIPAFFIMGLGLAGAMNCTKKGLWNEDGKFTKIFFGGIKKYWYKTMFATTFMSVIVFICGYLVLWMMKLNLLGQVQGWHWAVTILTFIALFPALIASYQIAPLAVTYDNLKLYQIMKNAYILAFENILQSLLLTAMIAIPILLMAFVPMLKLLVYVLFAMFGFSFYIMAGNLLGNYGFDIYLNPLYKAMEKTEFSIRKQQKRKEKGKSRKVKENKVVEEKKPKQAKTKNTYVNPKKKKKNNDK